MCACYNDWQMVILSCVGPVWSVFSLYARASVDAFRLRLKFRISCKVILFQIVFVVWAFCAWLLM